MNNERDFLVHEFKGQRKKEYNAEYYRKHKDLWKNAHKEAKDAIKTLGKSAKRQRRLGNKGNRRALLTAQNEASKAASVYKKHYKIFRFRSDMANIVDSIDRGVMTITKIFGG